MKKILSISLAVLTIALMSSCGVGNAIIVNHNQNSTQVQLSGKNFKVVDKVSGNAEVKYICLIGGLKQKQMYENAYSAMVSKANLASGARALVNIVTEEHIGGVPPFYYKRTVTLSAHVIEFTQ
jgi:hypothetical protein